MTSAANKVKLILWASEVLMAVFCVVVLLELKGQFSTISSRWGLAVALALFGGALIGFRSRATEHQIRVGSASSLRSVKWFWQSIQAKDVRFFYSFCGIALMAMAGAVLMLP
jgi:hypothetical protein